MIYLIVDQNLANPQSLNQAVEIITSNLGHYQSDIWDKLNKANINAVRYFGFSKTHSEDALEKYWASKNDKFKLVEVVLKSSFTYMPPKLKEVEAQGEVGSF